MSELRDKVIEYLRASPDKRFAVGMTDGVWDEETRLDCRCPVAAYAVSLEPALGLGMVERPDIMWALGEHGFLDGERDAKDAFAEVEQAVGLLFGEIDSKTGASAPNREPVPFTRTGAEILAALGAA